jgi:hypothetical protein
MNGWMDDNLLRIYLTSVAAATTGWIALGVLSVASSATGASREPSLVDLLLFAVVVVVGVRAHAAVGQSRDRRSGYGELADAARAQLVRLRRWLKAIGRGFLAAAVIVLMISWFATLGPPAVRQGIYIAFLIVGVATLIAARGVRYGWLEEIPRPATPTPQEVAKASEVLAEQERLIEANRILLSAQQREIKGILTAIEENERRPIAWVPTNLRWALVGFGFGIVGNWLTEPLFTLLIAPLKA